MTRVDFYIVTDVEPGARDLFACRLVEKAVGLGHKVYVHTDSADQARQFDDLLWTFRPGSFVPHELSRQQSSSTAPVLIGHHEDPDHHADVMVNVASEIPLFFSQFERVAELVEQDNPSREKARERFRFYRERGYPLQTHNV